jgi:hypothetical protein
MTVYVLREVWAYEYDVVIGVYSSMEALEVARDEYTSRNTSEKFIELEVSEFQLDGTAHFR